MTFNDNVILLLFREKKNTKSRPIVPLENNNSYFYLSAVVIIPFAGLDIIGMLRSLSRQDLIKMAMHILEKNMDLAAKTGANEVVVIFDMDNFNIRPYAWRPGNFFVKLKMSINIIIMFYVLTFC